MPSAKPCSYAKNIIQIPLDRHDPKVWQKSAQVDLRRCDAVSSTFTPLLFIPSHTLYSTDTKIEHRYHSSLRPKLECSSIGEGNIHDEQVQALTTF